MQFALAGDDGLVQFRINAIDKRRVLLVQGGQAGGDLVFLALGAEPERGVDGWAGDTAPWAVSPGGPGEQRVLPVCVSFNFTTAPMSPPLNSFTSCRSRAVEDVDLADAFGHAAVGVEKLHARRTLPE